MWTDTLGELDPNTARATYLELRASEDRAPSVARFMAEYHHRRAGRARVRQECRTCLGDRWVECTDDRRHGPHCQRLRDGKCWCHAVVPCPACEVGHPTPMRPEAPMTLGTYIAKRKAVGDWDEVRRLEGFLHMRLG